MPCVLEALALRTSRHDQCLPTHVTASSQPTNDKPNLHVRTLRRSGVAYTLSSLYPRVLHLLDSAFALPCYQCSAPTGLHPTFCATQWTSSIRIRYILRTRTLRCTTYSTHNAHPLQATSAYKLLPASQCFHSYSIATTSSSIAMFSPCPIYAHFSPSLVYVHVRSWSTLSGFV